MEQLNDRISFVEIKTDYNSNGFPVEIEEEIYKCWCNSKTLSFKEFYANYTTNTSVIVSFRVRKCKLIDTINSMQHKIKFKDKLYNIIYIVPKDTDFVDFKGELVNG